MGGWSPGPLQSIVSQLVNSGHRITEPSYLYFHTPPVGCAWCLNPFLIFLVLIVWFVIPYLWHKIINQNNATIVIAFQIFMLIIGSLIVFRIIVAALVRFSIYVCKKNAITLIKKYNVKLIIGFSWGGGIVSWMLEDFFNNKYSPSLPWKGHTVMLAPTITAMAKFGYIKLPIFHNIKSNTIFVEEQQRPLQINEIGINDNEISHHHHHHQQQQPQPQNNNNNNNHHNNNNNIIHLYQAVPSDGFCPDSQIAYFENMNCDINIYKCEHDNHIFSYNEHKISRECGIIANNIVS